MKFLLEKGSNLFRRTSNYEDQTVLHLASSLDLVSFLIEHGAGIHARDYWNQTPLHSAAKNGQTDSTINYLLDQGASANAGAYSDYNQGYWAAAVKLLIERGTNFQYTPGENVS